ncbi:hypothetical protein Trco_006525 [Trichoderma cornu-damae]|uniref:Uncharacterized protein n=1 Tax=Trichoderma cornu-damae TaxID=654480 RepID=A0A9P8QKR0_9HYPO|nr:hypothetical protein Trco_006525 [Trichoderma cornu-damae]
MAVGSTRSAPSGGMTGDNQLQFIRRTIARPAATGTLDQILSQHSRSLESTSQAKLSRQASCHPDNVPARG